MEDLENILKKVKEKDIKTRREITRRYIIVEGVYYNYGDICPLPKIMELKEKYCYR
jgi:serine palmitoyltransferase